MRAHGLTRIKKGALAFAPLAMNGAGHNVARRKFGPRIGLLHEASALGVDQHSPLAAQGLGGQGRRVLAKIHGRRMELDKFRIANDRAGQSRQAHAFAAHLRRGGGLSEQAADAAGRQDHRPGEEGRQSAAMLDQGADHGAIRTRDQTSRAGGREQGYGRRRPGCADDGLHDGPARAVAADTGDAGARMGRFQTLHQTSGGVPIKGRAKGDQALHRRPAFSR